MKKRLILLIIILFLPVMVEAKEYCTIVSGNGKTIGSEIACGTEHFYVIDGSGENIKMLSKYNLYVGANYNKIVLDINRTYIRYELCNTGETNCECSIHGYSYICSSKKYFFEGEEVESGEVWYSKIKNKYKIDLFIGHNDIYEFASKNQGKTMAVCDEIDSDKYQIGNKIYMNETLKLYPFEPIYKNTEEYALQNKKALGVTGEKGNANYPIYATTILFPEDYPEEATQNYNLFEIGYINFDFKESAITKKYLNDYKLILNNTGFNISDINLISLEEIENIVESVTSNNLPLIEWYKKSLKSHYINDDVGAYTLLGDLKEYLSDNYSWLWTTSYWTRTFIGENINDLWDIYFVSSSGEICYGNSGCYAGIPRAGIRPVVTISKDSIKYNIKTKTDGKGTIEVVNSAYGGEEIRFRVTAKKEYKLVGLTITTDSGEVVEFNEEDIISNSDGTMSISTNKFMMPYDNVLIQARWASSIVNPSTGVKFGFLLFMLFIIDFSIIYVMAIRKRQVN